MSGSGQQGGQRVSKKSTPIDIRRVQAARSGFKPITHDEVPQMEASESRTTLYVACAGALIAAAIVVYSLAL